MAGRPAGCGGWTAGSPTRVPSPPADLAAVSMDAAARGVTGFTDATPDATETYVAALADAVADGTVVQRVYCMAPVHAGGWSGWREPAARESGSGR